MASVARIRFPLRLRLLLAAVLIGLVLVVPQVRGDSPRMLSVDVDLNEGMFNQITAPSNQAVPGDDNPPFMGDFFSGQAPIMQDGARIGTFYFMSVGTVIPDPNFANFQSAANHIFAVGRMELWGQGSIDVQGTVSFFSTSYLSITGGTGIYAMASGQCSEVPGDENPDQFTCEIH